MNYLAHAYLSFNDPDILIGNLISDFVKGRSKYDYPKRILAGINLHRAIDNFTDAHDATRMAKEVFRPAYRLYSGAFVDVVYDHFLATDNAEFSAVSLANFANSVYITLDNNSDCLPSPFATLLPYMKSQDWLFNYRTKEGTKASFRGLVRRATYLHESENANRIFDDNHAMLRECYNAFFPAVKEFAYTLFTSL